MRYFIVTGQSGAGKTACVHFLEDRGSFCMDNMPPMMLPKLVEAFNTTPIRQTTVTIAVDVRSGEFFDAKAVAGMISELRKMGNHIDIIFMEASDETLLDRYKESRRDHPLAQEGLNLMEAITEERDPAAASAGDRQLCDRYHRAAPQSHDLSAEEDTGRSGRRNGDDARGSDELRL